LSILSREIREFEDRNNSAKFHPAGISTLVGACTRSFQSYSQTRVTLDWHKTNLHVTEEHHTVGPPVFHRVGKNIDVHEWAPVLAHTNFAQLCIGMAKTDRCLSSVYTGTKHFKFELGKQFSFWCFKPVLDAETGLTNREIEVTISTVFILIGWQLRWANNIEPIWIN
jgi:hypothetical protein